MKLNTNECPIYDYEYTSLAISNELEIGKHTFHLALLRTLNAVKQNVQKARICELDC